MAGLFVRFLGSKSKEVKRDREVKDLEVKFVKFRPSEPHLRNNFGPHHVPLKLLMDLLDDDRANLGVINTIQGIGLLAVAVAHQDIASTQEVLRRTAKSPTRALDINSAMCQAAMDDNVGIMKVLLEADKKSKGKKCERVKTPLEFAHSLPIAELLLENGYDVNDRCSEGTTPIWGLLSYRGEIAPENCIKITQLYLDKGADLSRRNDKGLTVYEYADTLYDMFRFNQPLRVFIETIDAHNANNAQKIERKSVTESVPEIAEVTGLSGSLAVIVAEYAASETLAPQDISRAAQKGRLTWAQIEEAREGKEERIRV